MVLQNQTNRMRIYVLSHAQVCGNTCHCVKKTHLQTHLDPRTGERGVREIPLSLSRSVHIPAGGVSERLPSSVLNCKQIAADVKARLLVVKGN